MRLAAHFSIPKPRLSGGRPAPQGNGYANRSGFNDAGPRRQEDRGFAGSNSFAPRNDSFAPRNEGFAARPDSANRKPAFGKPAGKVFVPRDAAKKPGKFARTDRE